jgi:hypothetical protein
MSNLGSAVALAADKGDLYEAHIDTSHVDERQLLRKIDIRVVPWLGLLYFLNFLDRGSIGNAKVDRDWPTVELVADSDSDPLQLYNMETDLGITDKQYLIALTAFFFPYALLEVR